MKQSNRVRAVNVDVVEQIAKSHRGVLTHFKASTPTLKADVHQWALDAANNYKTANPKAFRQTKKHRALDLMEDVYLPLTRSARALRDAPALRIAAATGAWEDASVHRLLWFCGSRGDVLQDLFVGSPTRAGKAKGAAIRRKESATLWRPLLPRMIEVWNQERTPKATPVAAKVINGLSDAELDRLAPTKATKWRRREGKSEKAKARNEDERLTFRESLTKRLATMLRGIDLKKAARLLQQLEASKCPDRQRAVATLGFSGESDYYEEQLQRLLLGPTSNDDSPVMQARNTQRFEDAEPFMNHLLEKADRAMAARLQRRHSLPAGHR